MIKLKNVMTILNQKNELDKIIKETHKEEDLLQKKSAEFEKDVEERLVSAYKKIRSSVKNGLAIVSVEGELQEDLFLNSSTITT